MKQRTIDLIVSVSKEFAEGAGIDHEGLMRTIKDIDGMIDGNLDDSTMSGILQMSRQMGASYGDKVKPYASLILQIAKTVEMTIKLRSK